MIAGSGTILLTWVVGVVNYGSYAAVFELLFFAQSTCEFSLDVFLVRRKELDQRCSDVVFLLLAASAAVGAALLMGLIPVLTSVVHVPHFTAVALWMFASLPVMHLQQIPLSKLERSLAYRMIGRVELAGILGFYGVGVCTAELGGGVFAMVAGWWTQQIVILIGVWGSAGYRPRFQWDRAIATEALHYGAAATSGNIVISSRNLVNPFLVSQTLGSRAVGVVGLTLNVLDQIGFIKQIVFRISISVLGSLKEDGERLRRAAGEGAEIQVLAVGACFVAFSWSAGLIFSPLFGAQWHMVPALVRLIAPAYLLSVAGNVYLSGLLTKNRPWSTVAPNLVNTILLWLVCLLLLSRVGVRGYGYAELVAMVSVVVTMALFARSFGRPVLRGPLMWVTAMSVAIQAPALSWWLGVAVVLPLLDRQRRGEVAKIYSQVRRGGDQIG